MEKNCTQLDYAQGQKQHVSPDTFLSFLPCLVLMSSTLPSVTRLDIQLLKKSCAASVVVEAKSIANALSIPLRALHVEQMDPRLLCGANRVDAFKCC